MSTEEAMQSSPDWLKLPIKLQHRFFEHAASEAQRTKKLLLEQKEKLDETRKLLSFRPIPKDDSWKDWRIALVDGSDSPVMSELVGGRFGTYSAGYHIFQGMELVDEEYFSGYMIDPQVGNRDASQKVLELLTTELEREAALKCLEKDVDLVMIDGPFFGFRARCRIVAESDVAVPTPRKGVDLVKRLVEMSQKLLDSGKAVGVVKRVETAAIDGWTIRKLGTRNLAVSRNDKDMLASFMKQGEFFSYEEHFGSHDAFNYLSRLAWAFGRFYTTESGRSIESIYQACTGDVERNIKRDLNCDPSQILATTRYFVRCSYPAPPFAMEVNPKMKVDPVLAFCQATCNAATGLPLPLDLVDQDVGIPRGFTQEFVEEIEATLARDPDLDKFELETRFSSLNPQKRE
jgi:hypothetical protein